MKFIADEIEYLKEMKADKIPDDVKSLREKHPAGFLPFRPNVLSPGDSGMIIEDVWPSLFFGAERIDEIKRKANSLLWARKTFDLMVKEADIILKEPPKLPLARTGCHHDFFSQRTAQHLLYDPKTHDIFVDPATGRREYNVNQHKAWILLTHERTYRIMRSLGLLYQLSGDERYAKWVAIGLHKAVEYFGHSELSHNSDKESSLYSSPLDDSSVLLMLAAAYNLTKSSKVYNEDFHEYIKEQIFKERISSISEFLDNKGIHNASCYAAAALVVAGEILEDDEMVNRGLTGKHGFISQLENGLHKDDQGNVDGLWYEGSMFYHFYCMHPLITLYEKFKANGGNDSNDEDKANIEAKFKSMFSAPTKLIDDKLRLPSLGDFGAPKTMNLAAYRHVYEYAAGCIDMDEFQPILSAVYNTAGIPRYCLSALAYGPDKVGEASSIVEKGVVKPHTYLPVAKTGVFRSKTPKDIYVLFRGGDYKEGHNHPDGLSLSIHSEGEIIAADLGEPGYSVRDVFHDYYRSTIAHNTIFGDEKDQKGTALMEWKAGEDLPRSRGIIKEGGVTYTRTVFFDPPYIILSDSYESESQHCYGWSFHAYGALQIDKLRLREKFRRNPVLDMRKIPEEGGYIMLAELVAGKVNDSARGRWKVKDKLFLEVITLSDGPYELSKARSPGNPVLDYCSTLMLRAVGSKRHYATVFEIHSGQSSLEDLIVDDNGSISIRIKNKGKRVYNF